VSIGAAVEHGLPQHVRAAFGVRDASPEPVLFGAVRAWRCGDIVIRPAVDPAIAAWSAGVLDGLKADGLRLARPVRSSDGRWIVAGWSAAHYLPGMPQPRHDETVQASITLHEAMLGVTRPRLLDDRDDLVARADAAAWGEQRIVLDPSAGGTLFEEFAAKRKPMPLPSQVVHAELFGSVLFHGDEPPAVLDLVPFWRPVQWAAAVVVVDALAWGGADPDLIVRWAHLDGWPQCLLRAVLFRLALHAQHPAATRESLRGLQRAAVLVGSRVR
jgi:uncharacterized protein (TIGR02569 family)